MSRPVSSGPASFSDAAGQGLFLDLDGTLADSLGIMRRAYDGFLAVYGHSGLDAEFAALNGPPLREIVRILKRTRGLTSPPDELLAVYREQIEHHYLTGVAPAAGAEALLAAARARGWRVAVVTSNRRGLAWEWLGTVGLADFVETVVGGEDVMCGKPAPDPYLAAIRALDCAPARSLAVEDSPQGAQAALAAGLETHVVGSGPGPGWPEGIAVFLPRLADLTRLFQEGGVEKIARDC
ncbi:HAD superfamily hydrolase (TIGR01509 family) [Azospirillum fermentarium]|uniref:HAD family hydrolase n=1 Tax=Azospirillum fermentarium TaxID=1233114 RepID=UPI0022266FAB|nr:HAD family phosphatase [Azospirillum fermentarium]MCW2249522.1 HAD superfamily hydrolase (TIGR01509 family) [Azospirillum fermentarium]